LLEPARPIDALIIGVGLLGLLVFLSLALLGLVTLMESADAAQRSVWLAASLCVAVFIASAVSRDVTVLRRAGAFGAGLLAALAALAGAQADGDLGLPFLGRIIPLVAVTLQLGFFYH
jgi:hypothetical protein